MIHRSLHTRTPMDIVLRVIATLTISVCFAQDVYLRLTDYGGGKISLYIQPFTMEHATPDGTTRVKNIEHIIGNDLDYSLYFDILADTAEFADAQEGVILQGQGTNGRLRITLLDHGSREQIMAQEYPMGDDLRMTAHTISDDIIEQLTGEKGIASTRIAFSYRTSSGKELAMVDYDGYNFTRLTDNGRFNLFPAWAPDPKRILFSAHSRDRLNIYLFDLTEKEIKIISSFRGLNFAPCWSPDGTKICLCLTKDGNAEIYLLDLKTEKLSRLTYNKAIDTSPAFSPNSREITFVSDRAGNPQIYVMDMHGGNVRRLTFHGTYNTSPTWSPRGDIIAYVSREADNSQQIYVTDPYDFSPIRLTSQGNNEEPSFSPDGLHIVFSSNRSGTYELYTMNWDGSRMRKLSDGITATSPDWSPVIR